MRDGFTIRAQLIAAGALREQPCTLHRVPRLPCFEIDQCTVIDAASTIFSRFESDRARLSAICDQADPRVAHRIRFLVDRNPRLEAA